MSNTSTNRFANIPTHSTAIIPTVGGAIGRKTGSVSGLRLNQDPSLEPVKKGNWVQRD
jgi:hypothetical protein